MVLLPLLGARLSNALTCAKERSRILHRARLRLAGAGELKKIVGGANQRPLTPDFVEPSQQELTKTSRLFDLSKHRLDHLLSQPISTSIATALKLGCHCHHPRLLLEPPPCCFRHIEAPTSSAGQIGANTSLGQGLKISFARKPISLPKSRLAYVRTLPS